MSEGKNTGSNVYRKRDDKTKLVKCISRHLSDERKKHIGEDRKAVTAEDIEVDVDEE